MPQEVQVLGGVTQTWSASQLLVPRGVTVLGMYQLSENMNRYAPAALMVGWM